MARPHGMFVDFARIDDRIGSYLIARLHQGTNLYRLNPDRIDYTFKVLKEFLQ